MDSAEEDQSLDALALMPVREQRVDFYGDVIPAAQTEDETIWVPLRPISEFLGLAFGPQRRRVLRDEVLAEYVRPVTMQTPGGPQDMMCLPLKLLPGWLFGVQASRVKEELREKILRYQREAYEVLWNAFKADILPSPPVASDLSGAALAVENARALLHLAEQQLEFERRLNEQAEQQRKMADYLRPFVQRTIAKDREQDDRLASLELQLSAGALIDETQVAEIQLAVKALAAMLQAHGQINGHQRVYAELYRRYGVGSYRKLPAARYQEVLDWLRGWHDELSAQSA